METYKTYQASEYLWNLLEKIAHEIHIWNFKTEAMALSSWGKASQWKHL